MNWQVGTLSSMTDVGELRQTEADTHILPAGLGVTSEALAEPAGETESIPSVVAENRTG
jgi:hypothetical protein